MKAMLATEVTFGTDKMQGLMKDVHWICEPKYDGIRSLVHTSTEGPRWRNRNDEELLKATPTEVTEQLASLPPGLILDGEIVGARYYVFDLPYFGTDLSKMSFYRRRQVLHEILGIIGESEHLRLSEAATYTTTKANMVQKGRTQHWEGIMLKHRLGLYLPGTRSPKMVKVKFTKRVDCIVAEIGREGKENAILSLWDGHNLVEVGKCSLVGKDKVKTGSVIEVHYLHANNGKLVQPRMVRVRFDKAPQFCNIQQLDNAHAVTEPL